jgi:hypothetical protein
VCGVGREDCDGVAGRQCIDRGFVGVGVHLVVCGVGLEGGVETVVELCDILMQMLAWKSSIGTQGAERGGKRHTNRGVLRPTRPNHGELPNLPSSSQIKHCKAHDAHLLVAS